MGKRWCPRCGHLLQVYARYHNAWYICAACEGVWDVPVLTVDVLDSYGGSVSEPELGGN